MLKIPNFVKIINNSRDATFIRLAYSYGLENANDKSTKNGALILDINNRIISYGAGGLHPQIKDTPERHVRPLKYWGVRHAERDSISSAAKSGFSTNGATLYVPWYACAPCAIEIMNSGIKKVIGHNEMMLKTRDSWCEEISFALQMMHEAGVELELFSGKIGGIETIMNEEVWQP